jgi:anti-anti-sigma factor
MSDTPRDTSRNTPRDTSPAAPVPVEVTDRAIIARPQVKLMDDDVLKALSRGVDEAAAAHPAVPLVVLDLSRVALLPSMALGLLVHMNTKCRSREQKLKLAGIQPQLRQVFAITKLDRVFQFADDVEAATA